MNREDFMHYVLIAVLIYLVYVNIGFNIGKIIDSPVVKEHFATSPATITQLNSNNGFIYY